jgi:hypothetical protein
VISMADRGGVAAGPSQGPVPEVPSRSLRWGASRKLRRIKRGGILWR